MADPLKQKALDLLTILSTKDISDSTTNTDPLPELSVLHGDLISLLSLLYAACTKIALVLNPSSPAFKAAADPLNDALKHRIGLSHCLSIYNSPNSKYGETLRAEVEHEISDVLDALKSFAEVQTKVVQGAKRALGSKAGDAERFMRVGAVHDMIDKAKKVSKDNVEAVRKRWEQDKAILEDSMREVEEALEEEAGEDEEDDGWDELGLGGSSEMTNEDRERTTQILALVKKTIKQHDRVREAKLQSSAVKGDGSQLDLLPLLSRDVSNAVDDLVATLYTSNVDEGELDRLKAEISRLEAIT
ncbi:hypothetical protein BDV98DRAFT_558149 [Pterulicium gracile]|uniref:Uncharacterized protein n=1 Tax=Pterulicium gracile TaxID=1884261 RepID=A0A5C3R369_9AGAR|nr:hypothetical protein BDV98DRAFT_558149 [Pterula gracilis]